MKPKSKNQRSARHCNGEAELAERDYPLIKDRIVAVSEASHFEDACREWEMISIVDGDDPEFVDRCEVCNQPGLGRNFKIRNYKTAHVYLVGSRCIKRFIILKGTENLEDSWRFFERWQKRTEAVKNLKLLAVQLVYVKRVDPAALRKFRHHAKTALGSLDQQLISKNAWKGFCDQLLADIPVEGRQPAIDKIRMAIFAPRFLSIDRSSMGARPENAWIKKRARVVTTLSKSGAYRDPGK